MSYDIWLDIQIDTGGPEPIIHVLYDWNYTSNCSRMWRQAGADLAEFAGKTAGECAPVLRSAIVALEADPETYRAMDPANGWGSYDTLLPRLVELAEEMEQHPKSTVRVSR